MERRYILQASAPVSIETREDGQRSIVGHGAVFYDKNDEGTEFELFRGLVERVKPSAFDRALADNDDARGLFNHDPDNLLGRVSADTLTLTKDKRGLRYEISVDENDPDHQRVLAKIERGDLTGSSFAFSVKEDGEEFEEGEDGEPDVRWLTSVASLYDVGPVTYPAYEGADTGLRSVVPEDEKRDLVKRYEAWKGEAIAEEQADEMEDERMDDIESESADDEDEAEARDEDQEDDGSAEDEAQRAAEAKGKAMRARAVEVETEVS